MREAEAHAPLFEPLAGGLPVRSASERLGPRGGTDKTYDIE